MIGFYNLSKPGCVNFIDIDDEQYKHIVEKIVRLWDIDLDTAEYIAYNNQYDALDNNMVITSDGEIFSSKDINGLKLSVLDAIKEYGLEDLAYVFVDGKKADVLVDISFKIQEEDPTSFDPLELEKMSVGQESELDCGDVY